MPHAYIQYIRLFCRYIPFAAAATLVLTLLTLAAGSVGPVPFGDSFVYARDAAQLLHGVLPYSQLHLEYLPGVVPILYLMGPLGWLAGTTLAIGFYLQTAAVVTVFLAYIYKAYGKRMLLVVAGLMVPLLQFVFFNLDIFSAVTLLLAVQALYKQHYGTSAAWLAVSTLIKTYPGVCLLGLFWLVPAGRRLRYLAVFGGVLAAVLVPLALLAPEGLHYAISYHSGRPIEFESTAAVVGYISHLAGQAAELRLSHASVALLFPAEPIVNRLATVLLAVALAGASYLIYRRRNTVLRLRPASVCIILLLVFVICFKVGSPQYSVPIIVLFPLFYREHGRRLATKFAVRFLVLSAVVWLQFMILFNAGLNHTLFTHYSLLITVVSVLRIVLLVELALFTCRCILRGADANTKLSENS